MTNADQSLAAALPIPNLQLGLFIGGQWRDGSNGERIDVIDPSTGKLLATIADATEADAMAAIDAAQAAAPAWAATPPRARAEILRRTYEIMVERADALALLISMENGKALSDAKGEVMYAAEFYRWYGEEAVRLLGEFGRAPAGANHMIVQHQPVGISLLVTPWNFPAAMATRKIGPALAAGCTVILKPAIETPLTALAIAAIMAEAGVPDGVVNIITPRSAGDIVSKILHDPRVRKLSFTGSTQVGRILLREAADNIVNCSMELGGNAAFIVLDDADLDAAIEGAMIAKMRNGGEACTAANRFYIQRGIHDAFVAKLSERMRAVRLDNGALADTQCGPMINEKAVAKIESLVGDAVQRGAKIVVGGKRPDRPGYFYEPTVMTGVVAGSSINAEEVFGPVAAVTVFDTIDEVVALANDTEYGLASYVYTQDFRAGLQLSSRLECGMVGLNRGLVSDPAAPFGGVKQSGIGREGGHHGMLEFTEMQYIAASW
ncbi:NAD-dependent succinate-semialdehyde dehydrogenase [Glacieibacterium sp.]|uniref:NAD-dependent succinate-semialdehyde dehydrogenase n=1 Tax=Glacieibacterium sp. TaxID=2860237 RepID=UPI003AFF761B